MVVYMVLLIDSGFRNHDEYIVLFLLPGEGGSTVLQCCSDFVGLREWGQGVATNLSLWIFILSMLGVTKDGMEDK